LADRYAEFTYRVKSGITAGPGALRVELVSSTGPGHRSSETSVGCRAAVTPLTSLAECRDERAQRSDERAQRSDERAQRSDERAQRSDERAQRSDEAIVTDRAGLSHGCSRPSARTEGPERDKPTMGGYLRTLL
jgi:hypothetical protein